MRTVLLTRVSAPQIYCANALHEARALGAVVLEEGTSIVTGKVGPARVARALGRLLGSPGSPARVVHRVSYGFNRSRYYGNEDFHHRRILRSGFQTLDPGLKIAHVPAVNEPQCARWLAEYDPDLVFVFGTGLLRENILESAKCPFVNMHWGWSPDYRGEGIVSALAQRGPEDLGVTVHLMDHTIDGGEILYRERPAIDGDDNFYSIGLKLARLGTRLFERVFRDYAAHGALRGVPQQLAGGKLYTSAYLAAHPELYARAWKNLSRYQRTLRA